MKGERVSRRAVLAGAGALVVTGGWRMSEAATTDGLDAGALAAMDAALAGRVDEGLPGLVTLVARGDEVHVTAAGAQDFGGAPMRRDTIFRIASMTKPIAAATTMALVEEGRLRLDEPVGRLLPEFAAPRVLARIDGPVGETVPAEQPMRVEDLLTMRMGTGALFDPAAPINVALGEAGLAPGPRMPEFPSGDAYAAALSALPLMRQPGEYWLYETPMQLLGVVLERAADKPLADLMAEKVFDPLGMSDTGFFVPEAKRGRLATCWWRNYGTGVFEVFDGAGPDSRFAKPPAFPIASGGLVSTADDWLRFGRMMLGGGTLDGVRVLSPASVAAMTGDRVPAEVKARSPFGPGFWEVGGWGLGMQVVTNGGPGDPLGCGWVGGTGTSGYFDAATGVVGVHLTQRVMESPEPTAVFTDFWTGVRAAAGV